jgi:hypothetical protein
VRYLVQEIVLLPSVLDDHLEILLHQPAILLPDPLRNIVLLIHEILPIRRRERRVMPGREREEEGEKRQNLLSGMTELMRGMSKTLRPLRTTTASDLMISSLLSISCTIASKAPGIARNICNE